MLEFSSLYQEIILDHYRNPQNKGLREPFDVEVRHVNPVCGDEVTMRVRLAGDRIEDVSYDSEGCSISQASESVLTELVIGRTVGEAMKTAEVFGELMASKGQLEPDEDRCRGELAVPVDARHQYAQTAQDRRRSRACALCPRKESLAQPRE